MSMFFLLIFGLIFGSFVNALVWRLHEQAVLEVSPTSKKRGNAAATLSKDDLSILRGRSMCPQCHHELAAKDLVPLFSWLSLRGKCRYCRHPISVQYPLVELVTSVLFGLAYLTWGHSIGGYEAVKLVLWLLVIVVFVALALYDIRWYELPTRLIYIAAGLGVANLTLRVLEQRGVSVLWQPVFAAVLFFVLFQALYSLSRGRWLGYGDVRLSFVLGLLAGTPLRALMVLFFASLIGTLITLPSLLRGKATMASHIPFGPYLIAGALAVQFWGGTLLTLYQKMLGN